ncbi:RING1 and YY1-binding protein [Trichechus manatus latirostris]|uniref:RING1 and YY1-binding protein n=1 Tax=Trichechus manatus latirostris TaxID=127582 RepID=A0A2Y9QWE4_TRIMA|nr:RING1 and YY1-binding protein [Trichechus manatus latirostris]
MRKPVLDWVTRENLTIPLSQGPGRGLPAGVLRILSSAWQGSRGVRKKRGPKEALPAPGALQASRRCERRHCCKPPRRKQTARNYFSGAATELGIQRQPLGQLCVARNPLAAPGRGHVRLARLTRFAAPGRGATGSARRSHGGSSSAALRRGCRRRRHSSQTKGDLTRWGGGRARAGEGRGKEPAHSPLPASGCPSAPPPDPVRGSLPGPPSLTLKSTSPPASCAAAALPGAPPPVCKPILLGSGDCGVPVGAPHPFTRSLPVAEKGGWVVARAKFPALDSCEITTAHQRLCFAVFPRSLCLPSPFPHSPLGRPKRQAKPAADEGFWDCSVCTFRNSAEAFKCSICDVRKGTSTRKPRINSQLVAQQVAQQYATPPPPKKEKKEKVEKQDKEKPEKDKEISPSVTKKNTNKKTKPKSDILKDPPSEANSIQSANATTKTSEANNTSRPRLKNVDRSTAQQLAVTVGNVTVIITDFKEKTRSSSTSSSTVTSSAGSEQQNQSSSGSESTDKGSSRSSTPKGDMSAVNDESF